MGNAWSRVVQEQVTPSLNNRKERVMQRSGAGWVRNRCQDSIQVAYPQEESHVDLRKKRHER